MQAVFIWINRHEQTIKWLELNWWAARCAIMAFFLIEATTMRHILIVIGSCLLLQACVHKLVTVPVKAVYTVGKYTVKGTAAVVGAVIPDGDDKDQDSKDHD